LTNAVEKDNNDGRRSTQNFRNIVADELPYYFTIEDAFHMGHHKNLIDRPIGIWDGPFDGTYWKDGKTP